MNDVDRHLQEIAEIRLLMERSSKFLSLSGLSGVSAGIIALAGCAAAYWRLNIAEAGDKGALLTFLAVDALLVLVAAIAAAIVFTVRLARRKGLEVWNRNARYLLANLGIPLAAGGAFCLMLLLHGALSLVPAVMLAFYGLALMNASKVTINEIRYLGIVELALGVVAGFLPGNGLLFWGVGFGVLHIAYGLFMYRKYEQ